MIRRWTASENPGMVEAVCRYVSGLCVEHLLLANMESARTFPFSVSDLCDLIRSRVWGAPFDCSAISFSRYADFGGSRKTSTIFLFCWQKDLRVTLKTSKKETFLHK